MSIFCGLLLLAASVTSSSVEEKPIKQVSVTFYYESLHPFCKHFFTNDLAPTFLSEHFNPMFEELNLVPFGLAKLVDAKNHEYVCEYGKAECQGNRLHACAIQHIEDQKLLMKYISCLMKDVVVKDKEDDYPVDKCRDEVSDHIYSNIIQCYNSDEGWEFMKKYGKITKKFFSLREVEKFVPHISFDNQRNDYLAAEALLDFRYVMHRLVVSQDTIPIDAAENSDESFSSSEGSSEESVSSSEVSSEETSEVSSEETSEESSEETSEESSEETSEESDSSSEDSSEESLSSSEEPSEESVSSSEEPSEESFSSSEGSSEEEKDSSEEESSQEENEETDSKGSDEEDREVRVLKKSDEEEEEDTEESGEEEEENDTEESDEEESDEEESEEEEENHTEESEEKEQGEEEHEDEESEED